MQAIASAIVFALGWIGSVVLLGFFKCFTLWKTGSLWFAAGFHFAFDFLQFFVIGTRNGSQTPQGTLFDARFPVALFAYVAWRYSARRGDLQAANETISPASR